MTERQGFEDFIDRFLTRYTKEEFDADLMVGTEYTGDIAEDASQYFSREKPLKTHREAVLSVRLGGISTRTIRNWKKGENIYSERSSKVLNDYFNQYLPSELRIDRRKLAWLWLAFRLKMTEAEATLFLKDCMGEREMYALDLHELVLRTALRLNSRVRVPVWDFFDAVSFAVRLQDRVTQSTNLTELYRSRTLTALTSSSGNAEELADTLALIYEDAMKELHAAAPSPAYAAAVTQIIEDRWVSDFSEFSACAVPGTEADSVEETKARLEVWAQENRTLFCAAYLSWVLSILRLLIEYTGVWSKHASDGENFFGDWYFNFAKELEHGENADFPPDLKTMANVYAYAEGEPFEKFAKEKCLIYFGRLLDPIRVSRRRLIEYWYVARRGRMNTDNLNELLERHRFRPFGEGETPEITDKLFRWKW